MLYIYHPQILSQLAIVYTT